MKMRFTMLALCAMFSFAAFAQDEEAIVVKTDFPPVIDGQVDDVWAASNTYNIDKPYKLEVTTLGDVGESNWKMLWDDDGIYVLVTVADDVFYPWYLPEATSPDHWKYDQVEIYFDCNYILKDGKGTTSGDAGNVGHYQFSADFVEGQISGELQEKSGWQFAANVEDPNYFIEYFIPMEKLLTGEGSGVDKAELIGFDAYIIDNDNVAAGSQQRAVWSNIGGVDQAWGNMDDCGTLEFEGAEAPVYVESITLEDGVIDENNGKIKIAATVLPEEASTKTLKWTVQNSANGSQGRASVAADGTITGILDGEVIITGAAIDGSWEDASCTVTISNQIVSFPEVNVIKNWVFDQLNDDGTATLWGGWIDETGKSTQVIDGVATMYPDQTNTSTPADPQQWRYQFNQNALMALPDVEYEFGFVAWADDDVADFPVDFEDIAGNDYTRYGATNSEWSGDGRSEWHIPITSIPTKYTMDLTFDKILENTDQKVQFMPGLIQVGGVYLDSVYLVSSDDLALIDDYIPVVSIAVSGDATVAVDGTAQMDFEVAPSTALLTDVRWSVVKGTGEATIDAAGMLTGVAAGTVTVVASAKDDSGVTGVMDVTVGSGVGIDQKSVETLKVYPNPAVNELNVVLNSENTTVSIYNSVGQKMEQVVVTGSEYKFDISSYAAGIYFVKTSTSIAKFVK